MNLYDGCFVFHIVSETSKPFLAIQQYTAFCKKVKVCSTLLKDLHIIIRKPGVGPGYSLEGTLVPWSISVLLGYTMMVALVAYPWRDIPGLPFLRLAIAFSKIDRMEEPLPLTKVLECTRLTATRIETLSLT